MESDSEYSENESSAFNEATLNNLKTQRENLVRNYREYLQKEAACELKDYSKYEILSNLKEPFVFQNDEFEDLGIREDLEMLEISK